MKTALILFSDDFRITDNPALFHAAQDYQNLIFAYIYNENYCGRKLGSASKVFLHHILNSFSELLKKEKCQLVIRKNDDVLHELKILAIEIEFEAIYFNNSYTAAQIKLEEAIRKNFTCKSFKAKLLFEPIEIKTSQKTPFKVFAPFSRECLKKADLIGNNLGKPKHLKSKHSLKSLRIDELNLLPKNQGRWHEKIAAQWEFDYNKIEKNIIKFIEEDLPSYAQNRNFPALNATSKLSPYLRFGVFSPRIIYHSAIPFNAQQFILELLWREFAHHVMYFNQDLDKEELKSKYKNFRWEYNKNFLQKWQKGKTGFEFVDAGMQELWQSGFMHNRLRMVTASFLIKNLLIDWRAGEEWFFDCLVDACPAINPFSWQWVFGSGYDAAPYFRVFNPKLQQEKFDPKNEYCKKWLRKNYDVQEIIDYSQSRKEVLARYKEIDSDKDWRNKKK